MCNIDKQYINLRSAISKDCNLLAVEAERCIRHLRMCEETIHFYITKKYGTREEHDRYFHKGKDGDYHCEQLDAAIEIVADYINTHLGCGFHINYDPRGTSIRLHLKSFHNCLDSTASVIW